MALQKAIEHNSTGFICEYWRICDIFLDVNNSTGTVTLCGYKDKASRDADKNYIERKQYTFKNYFTITEMNKVDVNIIKMAYIAIKLFDVMFTNAIDVFEEE